VSFGKSHAQRAGAGKGPDSAERWTAWSPARTLAVASLLSSAPACTDPLPNQQPLGWADEVQLHTQPDLNPDPHILEINLNARVETLPIWPLSAPTELYTYEGRVPGPLIELVAGDRLIVHFTNDLPEPTTVHWHGLRIVNEMDGAPNNPQPPIGPGESFDYDFVVPDAGTFWYHPHVNSSAQVAAGLYGAFVVHAPDESEQAAPPDELTLVLSDMGINEDGTLLDPESGGDLATLFGREGNVILVNGKWVPTLDIRGGITQRWRIVNAARSRYFQLELPGSTFTRIGNDGGLLPEPIEEERVLIIPGQRADVLVTPSENNGGTQFLKWIPYERGFGSTEFRTEEQILRLSLNSDPPGKESPANFAREIEALDTQDATTVQMRLTQMEDAQGNLLMGINGIPFEELDPWPAVIGETQIWEIENAMEWNHPFHLHGFFFQEVDAQGIATEPLSWQDSIDIPAFETRRIAVHFDERPGMWMFHCHILDHADAGMMGLLELLEP
jgi:FtsP/CotA-like multicopper oxidase with cupredoxin domain